MIRIGVVGYGERIADVIKSSFRKVEPDIRVVGIVDPDVGGVRTRLEDCDRNDAVFYSTLPEMVSKAKLDALVIGTRCNLHAQYAIEASMYDIPLFLEKPVAISIEQASELEKAFSRSKCETLVSFPLRMSPLCRLAKEYLDNGAIKSCEHICATNFVHYGTVYWEQHYRNYAVTQGLFIQKGTHDVDYITYLMGSHVVKVAAMACKGRVFGGKKPKGLRCSACNEAGSCMESPQNRKKNAFTELLDDHFCVFGEDCGSPETGMNEDSSSVLLEFASGAHGVYTQVFYSRRDAAKRGAILSGYDATLEFEWYSGNLRHICHHKPFTAEVKIDSEQDHWGGDMELAYNFMDIINGKGKSKADIRAGLRSIYTCLAAKESSETNTFVNVRQLSY